jgi:hypothetical protein
MSLTKEKEKQAIEVMNHLKALIISSKEFGHEAFFNEVVQLAEWFTFLADGHDVVPMYTTDKEFIAMKDKLVSRVEEIERGLKKEEKDE